MELNREERERRSTADPLAEDVFEKQISALKDKIRTQLEEKALTWVEEECHKRMETLKERVRQELMAEVEDWIEGELRNRMEEIKKRSQKI